LRLSSILDKTEDLILMLEKKLSELKMILQNNLQKIKFKINLQQNHKRKKQKKDIVLKAALKEFDGDYDIEELRLMRIKFISEVAN